MKIQNNYSLKGLNAYKLDVTAKLFTELNNTDDLNIIFKNGSYKSEKLFVIGEGYNTLFTKDFDGLVVKINIKGINKVKETDDTVVLEIGAGENWINLVEYTLNKGLSGLENLSLIPGSVGAAPIQNIAAYGQNFEDVFDSLDAFNIETGKLEQFNKINCKFGYRDSYFKRSGRGKYLITNVRLILKKYTKFETGYHSRYGTLEEELQIFASPPYTIKDISVAVTRIRKRKFPDWTKVGTAGSFFLNPVITKVKLRKLQLKVPDVQYYPVDKLSYPKPNDPSFDHANHVKVATGWLLEELGWKGKRIGNVGTSSEQSLVVINYGGATPKEILEFTSMMQKEFKKAYDIDLEPEVNII